MIRTRIALAIGLATLIVAQGAFASAQRIHRTITDVPIDVECLNDTILLDYEADIVISEVATYDENDGEKTWMFNRNVRQYGSATDSFGNSWKFRGHFSTIEHVLDGDWSDNSNFHLLSRDIFVSERGGLNVNLSFVTQFHIRKVDGIYEIEIRESSATCMPNQN